MHPNYLLFETLEGLKIIISLIIVILRAVALGCATDFISEKKGHYPNRFWLGFFFGYIGLIIAFCESDVSDQNMRKSILREFDREKAEKARIENQKVAEELAQTRKEELEKTIESIGSINAVVSEFLQEASSCDRYAEILAGWRKYNLDEYADYNEITKELENLAETEKFYGSLKEEVKNYISKLASKFKAETEASLP